MAVSTIDGTLEEAVVKRPLVRVVVYEKLRFRLADGREQVMTRIVAEKALAERLQPGTRGRFYLFNVIDHKGVCGLRDGSGGAWFAFIKGAENGMLISIAVGATAVLLSVLLRTWLTSWAVISLLIGLPMFILYRTARLQAERRFAEDEGRSFPLGQGPRVFSSQMESPDDSENTENKRKLAPRSRFNLTGNEASQRSVADEKAGLHDAARLPDAGDRAADA